MFLQFGCSEHLRLHLRIFRAFVWLLDLYLLHHWISTILSVNFHSLLCLVCRWHRQVRKLEENLHINELVVLPPSTVFCTLRTDLSTSTEMSTTLSVNCSLITLHGFSLMDWTFGIWLCNTTGTSITLRCAASPGS